MIIQSTRISSTGGVTYLARHLLDKCEENESIEILVGDRDSLYDAQTLADIKRSKYCVRHISISPQNEVSPATLSSFLRSLDREFAIGTDRPKLIVRHIKNGKSHFHIAISEVDPKTLRVLDCRSDFARMEKLARNFEQKHNETIQATRAERKLDKIEGFSNVARKRAERINPKFDRTKIKHAFAEGIAAFLDEIEDQGLRLEDGEKGAILVDFSGAFVASANRAAGVRKHKFNEAILEIKNEATTAKLPSQPDVARTNNREATPFVVVARTTGWSGQDCTNLKVIEANTRNANAASTNVEKGNGQTRSNLPSIVQTNWDEESFNHQTSEIKLDDLLVLAEEILAMIRSLFETQENRLKRQILERKKVNTTTILPDVNRPNGQAYNYKMGSIS